jgi:NitT/TauT family transport system substrate-binding protein
MRGFVILSLALVVAACTAPATSPVTTSSPAISSAAGPQPDSIRIATGAVSGVYAATFLAKESGLLERYGLEADLQIIGSGPTLIQAMLSGEIQFAEMSAPAPMSAALEGGDIVYLATALDRPFLFMVAAQDVSGMSDLRGRIIGANRVGTLTYQMTRLALRSAGLEMNRDVTVHQVGGQPELVAAMLSNQVAAGLLAPPAHLQAVQGGMHVIGDLAELGLLWPQAGVVSTRRQLAERPERVRNYLKAYSEALYLFRADRELGIKVLMQHTRIEDRKTAADTYDILRNRFIVPPYPARAAFETVVQEELAPANPLARELPIQTFYDDAPMRELEQSGFFRDLDARYPGAR